MEIKTFYYKIGPVTTTKVWSSPIPQSKLDDWVEDFKLLDLEDYEVYLGGKYVVDPINTDDIDICITGPIHDYMRLYDIMVQGYELALNKHNFFIDIKHLDNLNGFKYQRKKECKRPHIVTELGGVEMKMINGKLDGQSLKKTRIPQPHNIPPELSVNVVHFPFDKQIKYGKIYDCKKLF